MSLVLAQANNNGEPPDEFFVFLFTFICGFYLVLLVVGILFLVTLHKALARCRPRNRTMEPGQVWLNLIPIFGLVWQFLTVIRVAETLDNEFYERGWHRRNEDYGKVLGIVTCALALAGISLPALVCWIVYWVKIAGYSGQLAARDYDRYDDEYDDRDRNDDERRDRDRDDDRRPWERRGR